MLTLVGFVQGMLSFFNSGGEGLAEDVMKTKKYQVCTYTMWCAKWFNGN